MASWTADPDLLPGSFAGQRWVPAPTAPSRGDAIRTILDAVDADVEPEVEEALMALGVNPVELFFNAAAPPARPAETEE